MVVINTGPTPLCLFTVYAPAEHAETTVHKTKEEGDELEDAGKDEAPEWATKGKSE
jgi:oxalate decarboxylase/phosphoglucose isomerase-like protein (cupin superfamily)